MPVVQSAQCLSVPQTLPSVGSESICPLLSCTVWPLSVCTTHGNVFWICVPVSTSAFHSLYNVCRCVTLYCLLVLCHYTQWCFLQSFHSLSVPHTLLSVDSVSLRRLLLSTVYPLSLFTSPSTVCCFGVTVSTAAFYSPSNVSRKLTMFLRLVLWYYVHSCLLQSVHNLSVPHTVPTVDNLSPCPLLFSTVCPISVGTAHCTVFCLCVIVTTADYRTCSISVIT
jgi:hypothetical protein